MAYTAAELEAYLDEALSAEDMARIEDSLRKDRRLLNELSLLNSRRDGGVHSVGAIWRRHRLSCPTRDQWGSFLLGGAAPPQAAYLQFHLETIGCRLCQANVDDLRRQQSEAAEAGQTRRRRYFQSSAGKLRKG